MGLESGRFIDYSWPHFVKTRVLARCRTRCFDMLERHYIVSCFAFLKNLFQTWDHWIFYWRYDSRGLLSKKRVILEAAEVGLCITVFLKMDVMTFKEIIYLLKENWPYIWYADCLACQQKANFAFRLYKGRLKTQFTIEAVIYKSVF